MGMIHVQKFVLTVLGLASLPASVRRHSEDEQRREECNFSPIDESRLQNDSTSGSLLVVLFAAILCSSGFNKGK